MKGKHAQQRRPRPQTSGQVVAVPLNARVLLGRMGHLAQQHGVSPYAVGGCVRDWLLGIPKTTDVDVAIEGDGIVFAKVVARALGARVTLHEPFGTATLLLILGRRASPTQRRRPSARLRIDVATCRRESYAKPAAYPKVTPGQLSDDLFRRDFTINAMAMAIAPRQFGTLIDPYGGLKDLRARRLRILHPNSFIDDPSRILRAVRFVERFGLRLDPMTARALRQAIDRRALGDLNPGRWRKELTRMLEEPNPRTCLVRLAEWLHLSTSGR